MNDEDLTFAIAAGTVGFMGFIFFGAKKVDPAKNQESTSKSSSKVSSDASYEKVKEPSVGENTSAQDSAKDSDDGIKWEVDISKEEVQKQMADAKENDIEIDEITAKALIEARKISVNKNAELRKDRDKQLRENLSKKDFEKLLKIRRNFADPDFEAIDKLTMWAIAFATFCGFIAMAFFFFFAYQSYKGNDKVLEMFARSGAEMIGNIKYFANETYHGREINFGRVGHQTDYAAVREDNMVGYRKEL